jgi:hypothetical protein
MVFSFSSLLMAGAVVYSVVVPPISGIHAHALVHAFRCFSFVVIPTATDFHDLALFHDDA